MTEQELITRLQCHYGAKKIVITKESEYRNDGPDGYLDTTLIEVHSYEGGIVWRKMFFDFTHDATGAFEPDQAWSKLTFANFVSSGEVHEK